MVDQAPKPWRDAVVVGESASHHKTITDADIALYAGITGDFHRIHLDDEYARKTPYGRRLAHGAMLIGFMSAAGSILLDRIGQRTAEPNVSYGYDRVRFVRPVFVGDTITTSATVVEKREAKNQMVVEQKCVNQRGEVVAAATHIGQFV
jgi:3-hydroxybutyryl-CoA dehydratase